MASVILCKCGERVNTNLFSGAGVYSLILDSDFDLFKRPADDEAFDQLFLSGREVFRCNACNRLIVYWDKSKNGGPTYYFEESPSPKNP